MASVVLFHSVYGLGDLEREAAERLGAAGHAVTTPDLFAGATAATVEEGIALEERTGGETTLARSAAAVAPLPETAVLGGFSMGANVAAAMWQRPRAAGLLLFHGLGDVPDGPAGLPVQAHVAAPDAYAPDVAITAWRHAAAEAGLAAEVFRYPGAGHLFAAPGLPDHDPPAAALAWERATAFLGRLR